MDDPIGSHPTREEQLDILATMITDQAKPNDHVLDLGCGTGYVASLILNKRSDLHLTGVDIKAESIAEAKTNLISHEERTDWFVGNLEAIEEIKIPDVSYQFIITALTFHDLPDSAKWDVISFASKRLSPGGFFFLYDRLRLTEKNFFSLQKSIWNRIERVYGRGMRSAESFEAYEADIMPNNRPGRLGDYMEWFDKAGMKAQILHLHGNVALLGGSKVG
ncbi:MAG: class I SAM-dependent methyltransferase [Pseudomonadota bacterium]|nr:class I SAM-dependent methyltransferase [Pseudomonadota bacterium]